MTPRQRTKTREQILEAAARIIAELGPARATTKAIAEAAGCAEGSIYRYFPAKTDLFLEVYSRWSPEFVAVMAALPERAGRGTVRGTLQEVAERAVEFYRDKAPRLAALMADPQLLEEHRGFHRTSGLGPRRAFDQMTDYLRAEQALGRVHAKVQPVAGARLLLGACFQEALLGVLTGDEHPEPQRLAAEIAKQLMLGLETNRKGAA